MVNRTVNFRTQHSLEKRQDEARRIRGKYPTRIPVIVERANNATNIPVIDKIKFLVPDDLTVGQFVYIIRKRIKLSPEIALFIFVNNTLPPTGCLMSQVYQDNKEECGFLYVEYSGESAFGGEN